MPVSPPDRLCFARALLLAGWILVIGVVLVVVLDGFLRSRPRSSPAAAWVRALSLSHLSLVPSGRPGRHPEMARPGVVLRHDPRTGPES